MDLEELVASGVLSLEQLTAMINNLPKTPTRIAQLGLFNELGTNSLIVLIGSDGNKLTLVPTTPRGAPAQPKGLTPRNARAFQIPHMPQRSTVMADSLQNVRVLGSDDPNAGIKQKIKELQTTHRSDNDYTIEYHRIGALKGQILDADGSIIYDLYDEFDVTQQTYSLGLNSTTTKVRNKVVGAKRLIEAVLGGVRSSGYRVFSSPAFFDKFVSHPDVEKAYDRYQDGQMQRDDVRQGFTFAGVTFEEMNWKVGDTPVIADGDAYMFPLGVPDMFITRFGPADYVETVGTIGLPYYSKTEAMRFNKGLEIESQSNPINLNTRPAAVIKLQV